MNVLIGLAIYFTIGIVLAKAFVFCSKTAYKAMSELEKVIAISLVFVYPMTILLGIMGCFALLIDKLFKKIL